MEGYSRIEAFRRRPLIVYATSTRQGVAARMAGDSVREFLDQIDAIGKEEAKVDVLIHSTGGDGLTAWKLMSVLRERFREVGVLVPFMAFSAATLFALGADEIIMHPHASLGPIDPQITIPQADGKQRQFAYEDVGAFLRFLENEVKITDRGHMSAIVEKLFSVVDPVHVGAAKRASELSSAVGERLLMVHLKDSAKAKKIAENLNKSFFAHGDAVSRTRAKELQLKIADQNAELEAMMWEAYLGLENYMKFREAFIPLQAYLSDPAGAASVAPIQPVPLPSNCPPQVALQIWNTYLQQSLQATAPNGVEVTYSLVNAVVESARKASEYRSNGRMHGFRSAAGEIQLSLVDTVSGWKAVTL